MECLLHPPFSAAAGLSSIVLSRSSSLQRWSWKTAGPGAKRNTKQRDETTRRATCRHVSRVLSPCSRSASGCTTGLRSGLARQTTDHTSVTSETSTVKRLQENDLTHRVLKKTREMLWDAMLRSHVIISQYLIIANPYVFIFSGKLCLPHSNFESINADIISFLAFDVNCVFDIVISSICSVPLTSKIEKRSKSIDTSFCRHVSFIVQDYHVLKDSMADTRKRLFGTGGAEGEELCHEIVVNTHIEMTHSKGQVLNFWMCSWFSCEFHWILRHLQCHYSCSILLEVGTCWNHNGWPAGRCLTMINLFNVSTQAPGIPVYWVWSCMVIGHAYLLPCIWQRGVNRTLCFFTFCGFSCRCFACFLFCVLSAKRWFWVGGFRGGGGNSNVSTLEHSLDSTLRRLVLHLNTHLALRFDILSYTWTLSWLYALTSCLTLEHSLGSTLWHLVLHLHTHLTLRFDILSYTWTLSWLYALTSCLTLEHSLGSTLWHLVLHLHTHLTLRFDILSYTWTLTWLYALTSCSTLEHSLAESNGQSFERRGKLKEQEMIVLPTHVWTFSKKQLWKEVKCPMVWSQSKWRVGKLQIHIKIRKYNINQYQTRWYSPWKHQKTCKNTRFADWSKLRQSRNASSIVDRPRYSKMWENGIPTKKQHFFGPVFCYPKRHFVLDNSMDLLEKHQPWASVDGAR